MQYLEKTAEIISFLETWPYIGNFFANNGPIVIGIIGVWLLWLALSKSTPLSNWIKLINDEAKSDLEESDLILLISLRCRFIIYKCIMPIQAILILALIPYLLLFSSFLFKAVLILPSDEKFSVIVISGAMTIICGWLINLQRLYLFQLARFIKNNRINV